VVVLLDVYSFLDNVKYPMEQVIQRMHYYKFIVIAALEAIGIPSSRVRFIQESSYVNTSKFTVDQWKLCTLVPQQAVRDAWDRSSNPNMLSPMFCPGLQALAEEHLNIDFQFGGADQVNPRSKICHFGSGLTSCYSVESSPSPTHSFHSSDIENVHIS
jgi:tyrosyl-tRNA synthetase